MCREGGFNFVHAASFVNCCVTDYSYSFLHKYVLLRTVCTFHTWLYSTSGICSCSYSLSLFSFPLLLGHTRGTAFCSFSFQTVTNYCHSANTPCLQFRAVPGLDFSHSNLESPPGEWAQCARRCWTCPQLRRGSQRCSQRAYVFGPAQASVPGRIWFSGSYQRLWTQTVASSMSERCSFQTRRDTCMISSSSIW